MKTDATKALFENHLLVQRVATTVFRKDLVFRKKGERRASGRYSRTGMDNCSRQKGRKAVLRLGVKQVHMLLQLCSYLIMVFPFISGRLATNKFASSIFPQRVGFEQQN